MNTSITSTSSLLEPISVMVADDHPMILNGVAEMISRHSELRLAGRSASGIEAVAMFDHLRPDVAIFDMRMPDIDGVEATRRVREIDPAARVVIFTSFEEEDDVRRALRAGALGYLSKTAPETEVVRCITAVAGGSKSFSSNVGRIIAGWLTPGSLSTREMQILQFVALGECNKRVARRAGITEGTAKSHLKNIFRKLDVSSRTEAVSTAVKRGIIRMA